MPTTVFPLSTEPRPTASAITTVFPDATVMPAQAEAAAALLAPRLFGQAAATDVEGSFPTLEFGWLHATGLLTAARSAALGGAGLHTSAATLPLLRVLQHI